MSPQRHVTPLLIVLLFASAFLLPALGGRFRVLTLHEVFAAVALAVAGGRRRTVQPDRDEHDRDTGGDDAYQRNLDTRPRTRRTGNRGTGRWTSINSTRSVRSPTYQAAPLKRKLFCRTFSDCTTGPRMGLVSGCYPLDPFYAAQPEAARIRSVRTDARTAAVIDK